MKKLSIFFLWAGVFMFIFSALYTIGVEWSFELTLITIGLFAASVGIEEYIERKEMNRTKYRGNGNN